MCISGFRALYDLIIVSVLRGGSWTQGHDEGNEAFKRY
ncbi:hypothetical protein OROMI_023078 [Orobanche minor]